MNTRVVKIGENLVVKTFWCEPNRIQVTTLTVNGQEIWRNPVPVNQLEAFTSAIENAYYAGALLI